MVNANQEGRGNLGHKEGSREGRNNISDEADEIRVATHSRVHTEFNSSQAMVFATNPHHFVV